MRTALSRRRLVAALFLLAIVAALELLSSAGLVVLQRRGISYLPLDADRLSEEHEGLLKDLLAGRPSLFQHDAVLGWTLRPGFRSDLCSIGPDGLRRDPERPEPDAPAVRVAAFGDSFTFGGDVVDRDAYPEVLARLDERLDVANFGVPAYGLDQAFLRYQQDGRSRRPQIVVIGFMAENIFRNVSAYRPFYRPKSQAPLAKPRYELRNLSQLSQPSPPGEPELALVENPLPRLEDYRRLIASPAETLARLGRHDFFFRKRPHASALDASSAVRLVKLAREQLLAGDGILRHGDYNTESEAFRVTAALFTAFYEMALRDGAQPVILIFPERSDLVRWRGAHALRYAPLLQFLATKGYRVIDAMSALDAGGPEYPVQDLIPAHFSPLANQLVAEHLLERLRGFGLVR